MSDGTLKLTSGHSPSIFPQNNVAGVASFTILKPTSPPKVGGFPVLRARDGVRQQTSDVETPSDVDNGASKGRVVTPLFHEESHEILHSVNITINVFQFSCQYLISCI